MHRFTDYVNPFLGDLLSRLDMDKRFVRGEGCWLYDEAGNRYLDAVAAYGALPFGFNHPEIWQAVQAVQQNMEPSFVQPSALEAAGDLARRLIELAPAGLRYVTFTNSGAEGVEAAFKLARSATGRKRILSAANSFHGKTLGALSATNRDAYQAPFFAPVEGFDRVPFGDAAAIAAAFAANPGEYAAFIVEPIQGEGGIVEAPAGYLQEAKRLCAEHGALLILDEVQAGLGRTGKLFACEGIVEPDVMVLAKALGGGLLPIGAVLCSEAAYTEDFGNKHSSTFAGNTLACRVGLAAVELLTRDDQALLKQVAANGAVLKAGLEALQRRYPHLIGAVRGQGYMLGVEFKVTRHTFKNSLLGVLAEQENLTPVITSYLLNTERVRVAPTLNGANVIRVEPPLILDQSQVQLLLASFERMMVRLAEGNTAAFVRHLVDRGEDHNVVPLPTAPAASLPVQPSGEPSEGRFAFLLHPVDMRNYPDFDPSLAVFNDEQIARLLGRFDDLLEPFIVGEGRITSATGATAFGEFIGVSRTADELMSMPPEQAVAEIKAAVDMAVKRGARIVGLGAYTSVVTKGGTRLRNCGVPITTGNSYTVLAAAEAVLSAAEGVGLRLEDLTLAVVGATGAIGRATAILLAERLPRLVLVGNPERPVQARKRLLRITSEIARHLAGQLQQGVQFAPQTIGAAMAAMDHLPAATAPDEEFQRLALDLEAGGLIVIGTDCDVLLPQADVIVTATSATTSLVTPDNVKSGAVVCDLSRPANVSVAMREARPDVLVIDGGVIEVPGRPSFGWDFGFEQGLAYACMSETILLALDHDYQDYSLGADLGVDTIVHLRAVGRKHGFKLAQLRSFDRPLTRERWEEFLAAKAGPARAGTGDD